MLPLFARNHLREAWPVVHGTIPNIRLRFFNLRAQALAALAALASAATTTPAGKTRRDRVLLRVYSFHVLPPALAASEPVAKTPPPAATAPKAAPQRGHIRHLSADTKDVSFHFQRNAQVANATCSRVRSSRRKSSCRSHYAFGFRRSTFLDPLEARHALLHDEVQALLL